MRPTQLPHALCRLRTPWPRSEPARGPRIHRTRLGERWRRSSRLDRLDFLAILDLLDAHFAVDELVDVRDDDGALDVHERERGGWVAAEVVRTPREVWMGPRGGNYPLCRPVQAPVAEPGLTKNRPPYSRAWNLARTHQPWCVVTRRVAGESA